jgi:hypothetical protein
LSEGARPQAQPTNPPDLPAHERSSAGRDPKANSERAV